MKGFIYFPRKVSSLFLLTLFLSPQMAASPHGWGKVTMGGEIVDTACAIDIGSRDQTINMGVLPTSYIREVGKGPIKEFNIKLVDCRWEKYSKENNEWNSFEVTFDGPSEGVFSPFRVRQKECNWHCMISPDIPLHQESHCLH
ncbi:fimbrial protein [Providencia vermicola]